MVNTRRRNNSGTNTPVRPRTIASAVEVPPHSTYASTQGGTLVGATENICKLAEKFYPEDFLGDEKIHLQCELQHYGLDVPVHPDLKNLSTLGDLCHGLVTTGKTDMYPLVDRLLRLALTLPASTATSERAFSAMKIVKTSLRNRMEDEFLRDYLIVYIEKEIAETISAEEIIDSFYLIKERRAHLK
ncbi:uncharacterized protein LOC141680812 [Apium graveolens]|uniref:uncharacterized protein LOC141680812 n=1 Tax=Apium graveolens TaxID=4045 RepID=UPI003D79B315